MLKDNSTFSQKRKLRLSALRLVSDPVVMETNAGAGKLFASCYGHVPRGVCFELKRDKADILAGQRPTWAVYCCDTVSALKHNVGSHLIINFLDVDPYGEPWPILEAFFASERPRAQKIVVVVQDGLRVNIKMHTSWKVASLQPFVSKYGNAYIYTHYKEVAKELLASIVAKAGYKLTHWTSYYCGNNNAMTHFAGVLEISSGNTEVSNGNA